MWRKTQKTKVIEILKKDQELEEEYEEVDYEEETEEVTEKDFETILSEGDRVYFLESDGNWWSQKVKSSEIAKQIVENFKK